MQFDSYNNLDIIFTGQLISLIFFLNVLFLFQPSDNQSLENKCKLLLANGHRLELKYKKIVATCEEYKSRIETLEKEKQELEEEVILFNIYYK